MHVKKGYDVLSINFSLLYKIYNNKSIKAVNVLPKYSSYNAECWYINLIKASCTENIAIPMRINKIPLGLLFELIIFTISWKKYYYYPIFTFK